ncbi:MAG TPA: asparagine synthase-related protein, partial [Acidobacteriaceae bacterium]|nr:asparagine synthase-related protein [Acidobacteriaceae bacterium]
VGGAYLLRRGLFLPWELGSILGQELAKAGQEELQAEAQLAATIGGIGSDRFQVSALEASWYMRNQLLRDTDWASMSHSVEVRVPFVDVTLWSEVARLVGSGASIGKQAMASTPAMPLPSRVLGRAKTGFQVPTREWMQGESSSMRQRGLRGWAHHLYLAVAA